MIDLIKEKFSRLFISRKLKSAVINEQDFSEAFRRAGSFFILMPDDEKDFRACFVILDYLDHLNKSLRILTRDYRISLLPAKFRNKTIEFGVADLSKLDLPSNKLIEKLSEMRFNAVMDLNRTDNLFFSYTANLVNARIRIGFSKKGSDKFYNFQIANNDVESELAYSNFLNCLKMF